MIARLWLLARGEVRLRVTGAHLPRFLNLCARQSVTLRRMERTAWDEMYATVSLADFRALRRHMGRTGCRVHIVRRQGAPFLAARLRPRYALWGGFFVFLWLCWVLCAHIWAIEPHISAELPAGEILHQLEELGVRVGARRASIDTAALRWQMLQMQPSISFFSLNIEGNRLVVEAYGEAPPEALLDGRTVTKVVAARDGVVRAVRAYEGQPLVRAGDAVAAGDTLISGLVPPTREGGQYRLAHAYGEVEAFTSYHTARARALEEGGKRYTGKVRRQYALVLGNKRLNLYFGSGISAQTCDKIVTTKTLWLSERVVFPVSLVEQTYVFYETAPRTRTAQALRVDMISRALAAVAAGMDGSITGHTAEVAAQDGAAVLRLTAHAVEQIGVEALDDSTPPPDPPAPAP